jgi:hypothetical protein
MATAEQYAQWIVDNQDKKGTPEFETVAQAYKLAKTGAPASAPDVAPAVDESAAETARLSNKPRPKTTGGSRVASVLAGLRDPLVGLEQGMLNPKNVNPVAKILQLVDYGVGKITGDKRGLEGSLERQRQSDIELDTERQAEGREGFDFLRLGGNIANPLTLYSGAGAAPTVGSRVAAGAALGTISGATAPLSGEVDNFVTDKLFQAGFGTIVGGAIPVTVETAKGLIRLIRNLPITEANKTAALQKYVLEKAGPNADEVAKILKEAPDIVPGSQQTAMDVLADRPDAIGLLKEQQRVAALEAEAPRFLQRQAERQAARQQELTGAFGTADDMARVATERTNVTTPLREQALAQADVYGQVAPRLEADLAARTASAQQALQGQGRTATEAAQAQVRADTFTPVPGYPRFPGRYSPNAERAVEFKKAATEFGDVVEQRKAEAAFKQAQLTSLKDEGFYPLETGSLVSQIDKSLRTPGQRSNEILVNAQSKLRDKLVALSDENGIINSADLYNVRKGITDDIQEYLTSKTGNASLTTEAANVEKALKKQLDASITKASGTNLWGEYLENYSKYSQKLDRMAVGQKLKEKLGEGSLGDVEKAGAFATAIQQAPTFIKRTTGAQRYDKMEDFLSTEQMASVNRVLADLSQAKKADALIKQVNAVNPELLSGAKDSPALLDSRLTFFKSIMETLRKGSQRQFDAKIAELTANPKQLGLFIEAIPKKDLNNVATAMTGKMTPSVRQAFIEVMSPAVRSATITQTVRD